MVCLVHGILFRTLEYMWSVVPRHFRSDRGQARENLMHDMSEVLAVLYIPILACDESSKITLPLIWSTKIWEGCFNLPTDINCEKTMLKVTRIRKLVKALRYLATENVHFRRP